MYCVGALRALILAATLTGNALGEAQVVREVEITGNTRTKAEVIRRELLFEPGDTLTVDLIEETERNLRAFLFLGDVELGMTQEGNWVDVLIRVRDLYARAITPLLSGEPDELSYGAVGLDYNFLGRGQILEVTAEHDPITGDRARVFYRAPRLSGSRLRLDLDGEISSDGHHASIAVARPFFRLAECWSVGASVLNQESVVRLNSGESLAEQYDVRTWSATASVRRSYGEDVKARTGVFLAISDRSFEPETGFTYAPADRRRVLPSLGLTVWRPQYDTTRFLRRLGRKEDVQTGSWATVRVGASLEAIGSDRDYQFFTMDLNPRLKSGNRAYLFSRFTLRGRMSQGRIWNVFGSAEAVGIVKIRETHSFAARARYDGLGRTEDATQYLLGTARGLRGYALRRFDGSRRLIFNVEARPTLLRRRDYTLAGVVFVDGGSAWTPGQGGQVFAIAVGIGGRVGLTRVYNSPILRADVGYGFEDRAWVLYMGLGQYF